MSKKKLLILLLVIVGVSSLFFFIAGDIMAQTATPSATTALSPTRVTSLPQTGVFQYAAILFVVSLAIIVFAFVF